MKISLFDSNLGISGEKGITPIFATVLLIGITMVFAGVVTMSLNRWTGSTSTPSATLSLKKEVSSDNTRTVYLFSHEGGDTLQGEDYQAVFSACLENEDNLCAEEVSGSIINLDSDPVISWDKSPTETNVSMESEPLDSFRAGETWNLIFEVQDSAYSVEFTRLSLVHNPSQALVFMAPFPEKTPS